MAQSIRGLFFADETSEEISESAALLLDRLLQETVKCNHEQLHSPPLLAVGSIPHPDFFFEISETTFSWLILTQNLRYIA